MRRRMTGTGSLAAALALLAAPATAQTAAPSAQPAPAAATGGGVPVFVPAPGPTPVPVAFAPVMAPSGPQEALRQGLAAADRRDWSGVRQMMAATGDARVRSVLEWTLASEGDATFAEMDRVLREGRGLPQRRAIRIRAEEAVAGAGIGPEATRRFLERVDADTYTGQPPRGPISGEGKIALAGALFALGETDAGRRWLSEAWRTSRLDTDLQRTTLERFGQHLSAEDHDARVDFLLWADRRTQARALIGLMTPQGRASASLRLGLAAGEGAVLTGAALDDRGIQYERVRRLRQADRDAEALRLLVSIDVEGLPQTAHEALWTERRVLLNEAIRTRDWNAAYTVTSRHGQTSGAQFADGEFVAGWVALRFLNQPEVAARHFRTLDEGVSTAISRSRALYWRGRAAEALGQADEAERHYRAAAAFPTFYYGQLAAVRLGQILGQTPRLTLPPERRATAQDRAALDALPQMAVLRMLADLGQTDLFRQFALASDDVLTTEGQHQALSEFARGLNQPLVAIRVAKSGLNRGVLATEAAFPMMAVPRLSGYGQIEDAFTLAITRQESEFNPAARSRADARGLMQFLPATATAQARRMGIDHRTEWLISRPEHNVTLGSAHLRDLVDRFNGSYVLAIVAYNAGPGRSVTWSDVYGDPRGLSLDDAIDWVEMIPFSETRNYVQRVLENIQVYRARLGGDSAPLELGADLTRGTRPTDLFQVRVMPGSEAPPPEAHEEPAPAPETPG